MLLKQLYVLVNNLVFKCNAVNVTDFPLKNICQFPLFASGFNGCSPGFQEMYQAVVVIVFFNDKIIDDMLM
ncbi:hypothetical protein D3C86_1828940 [compost metagenome]